MNGIEGPPAFCVFHAERGAGPGLRPGLFPELLLAKPVSRFVCRACGAVTPKWAGRCETCGEWNTVEEETVVVRPGPAAKAPAGRSIAFVGLAGSTEPPPRAEIGIAELDRVLGGGLVPASAVLVGGDPGIGK
jgi:DNA repair protein RadA/Sms